MYRFSYSEILEDAPEVGRERERAAFDRALAQLRDVEARGLGGPERTAAVGFVQDLWNVLIADLLAPRTPCPRRFATTSCRSAPGPCRKQARSCARPSAAFPP